MIAIFWNGNAFVSHHSVACGSVSIVSVSPVGALSTTIRSHAPDATNSSSQSSTEPSFIPGSAASSSAATSLTPCHLNAVSISSRTFPQGFRIE